MNQIIVEMHNGNQLNDAPSVTFFELRDGVLHVNTDYEGNYRSVGYDEAAAANLSPELDRDGKISCRQIEALSDWIDRGAFDEPHFRHRFIDGLNETVEAACAVPQE